MGAQDPLGEPKRATPTAFGCPGGPKGRPLQRFGCPGGPKGRPLQRFADWLRKPLPDLCPGVSWRGSGNSFRGARKGDPYSVWVPRRLKRATPTAFGGPLVAGLGFGFENLCRTYALGCPGGVLEIPLGEPKRVTPAAFGCPGGPKRRPLQRLGAPEAQKGDPYSVWRASGRRARVWLRKPLPDLCPGVSWRGSGNSLGALWPLHPGPPPQVI